MPATPRALTITFLLVSLAAIAGCIGEDLEAQQVPDDATEALDEWWVNVVPSSATDDEHDHFDHEQHANLTTPNFNIVGHDPLITDRFDETTTGMMCGGVATRDDDRRIAVVHSIDTAMAAMIADVTDPENPQLVGEIYMPNGVTWDADITEDGMHILVGAYPVGVFGGEPTLPGDEQEALERIQEAPLDAEDSSWTPEIYYRNACTGETTPIDPPDEFPYGPGLALFSIEDPSMPTFEDWVPQPIGPHSVGAHHVNGMHLATSSVTNLVHEASYYAIFEIMETPEGSELVPYTMIRTPGLSTAQESQLDPENPQPWLTGHLDVWIHEHPFEDILIAYLANWDGVYTYDISIPHAPIELGFWDDEEHRLHTVYPVPDTRDDRQYLIATQEVGEPDDRPTGWVYILDVTDPTNIEEKSRWTLPENPHWDEGGLMFSTHYVDVYEDTLFAAVNHAGLWAINITDIEQPHAEGVFVPSTPSPKPWQGEGSMPHTGDVIVDQTTGILTTWDTSGGIYQLTYDAQMPIPPAPAWNGDA